MTTTPPGTWTSAVNIEDLRERLVEFALARKIIVVRYIWRTETFRPLLVGRVAMVQTTTLGLLLTQKTELRFVPLSAIVTAEPLQTRRQKSAPP